MIYWAAIFKNSQILKTKSIYIDGASWQEAPKVDDFIVAIGKTKSNSVYHIFKVKSSKPRGRMVRYYLEVLNSDLQTLTQREKNQKVIPMKWYSRKKKCS